MGCTSRPARPRKDAGRAGDPTAQPPVRGAVSTVAISAATEPSRQLPAASPAGHHHGKAFPAAGVRAGRAAQWVLPAGRHSAPLCRIGASSEAGGERPPRHLHPAASVTLPGAGGEARGVRWNREERVGKGERKGKPRGGNSHYGVVPRGRGGNWNTNHLTWDSCTDAGLKVKASKRMKAGAHALLLARNREGPWGRHPQPSVPTQVPWPLPAARCLMRASDLLSRSLPGLIKSLLCSYWPLLPL